VLLLLTLLLTSGGGEKRSTLLKELGCDNAFVFLMLSSGMTDGSTPSTAEELSRAVTPASEWDDVMAVDDDVFVVVVVVASCKFSLRN
jgi:hypothetical protein